VLLILGFLREFTQFHAFTRKFAWIHKKKFTIFGANSPETAWINSQILTDFHRFFYRYGMDDKQRSL
jgi:hypothetical protein